MKWNTTHVNVQQQKAAAAGKTAEDRYKVHMAVSVLPFVASQHVLPVCMVPLELQCMFMPLKGCLTHRTRLTASAAAQTRGRDELGEL